MSEGEGAFRVATAYVALVPQDEGFSEEIAAKIEEACSKGAEEGGNLIVEKLEASANEAGELVAAPLVEAVARASEEAANLLAENLEAGAEEGGNAAAAILQEIAESEAALFGELGAVAKEQFVAQVSEAEAELAEIKAQLELLSETTGEPMQPAEKDVFQQYADGAISAQEAIDRLTVSEQEAAEASEKLAESLAAATAATEELGVSTGLAKTVLTTMMLAGDGSAQVLERFGTSEAQLAVATNGLAAAEENLELQNEALLRSYALLATGSDTNLSYIQKEMAAYQSAQSAVASMATAQVAAFNEVNLAVIQNETAFMDEASALRALASASEVTGVDMAELSAQLEAGQYKALSRAAADAQETLQSVALGEAQQKLAAANLTLVDTYSRLAAGEEVATETQAAVVASAKAAAAAVAALDGSAEKAAGSMGGMGGGMMAQMVLWMGASYIPQLIGELEKLGDVGDHTALGVTNVEASLEGLQTTVPALSGGFEQLGTAMTWMSNVGGGKEVQGLQDIDNALAQLYTTDPELAAEQVAALTASMEAQGTSASQVANYLSAYNTAVQTAQVQLAAEQHAVEDTIPGTEAYTIAVENATLQMSQQALQAQETADAQTKYLQTVTPATVAYTQAIQNQVVGLQYQGQQAAITATAQMQYYAMLVPGTQEYAYAMTAATASLVNNTTQTRINAEALNQSLPQQQQLSEAAIAAAGAYTQAQQATTAYTNALTALYGQYGNTSDAEATFTTDLNSLTGTVKSGTDAVALNTKAGAANYQAFYQVSQQALTTAGDIYQTTNSTQQANTALQNMATALDTAASKAGLTKAQVQQLNTELFGVPTVKDISINLNDSAAMNSLNQLSGALQNVMSGEANLAGGMTSSASALLHTLPHRATGGPVQAGQAYIVGEKRAEVFIPDRPGQIYPSVGQGAQAAGGVHVTQVFQANPSVEDAWNMKREMTTALAGAMGGL